MSVALVATMFVVVVGIADVNNGRCYYDHSSHEHC
jgi:hypothetical protein